MDQHTSFVMDARIQRTMKNLEKNNITAWLVENETELMDKLTELIPSGSTIGIGGSMTLFETGTLDHIRNGSYQILDRYAPNLTPEDIKSLYRKSFSADVYLTGTNAVTEDGELYNVDGTGNRVAAMIYGPDRVIVIVGRNKLVKDADQAVHQVREMASPANNKRLNLKNPCTVTGVCSECQSPTRICNAYTLIRRQMQKGRIHVVIVNKDLGY
jgi:hypothetical protein